MKWISPNFFPSFGAYFIIIIIIITRYIYIHNDCVLFLVCKAWYRECFEVPKRGVSRVRFLLEVLSFHVRKVAAAVEFPLKSL